MFERILIANRGEIACRVMQTCRRLGIGTVAVYSEADAQARHVREADVAFPIGGPAPADSYLRGDAIIEVALKAGAQAIHPGYGFLSENADFVEAVEAAGLVFIGPTADTMRRMGSKAGAKDLMAAHGVPVVPGYSGADQDPALLAREADRIGYPLMIKAAHGGGGKGMRIVRQAEDFAAALESCQREARGAFGNDRVLLERYIEHPRHIEFQVFGDRHGNRIHLGERECSAQRRYQKVLEETPSPFLDDARRTAMGEAAIAAAAALDYVNAGTVEFIVGQDGSFHFMEINTRLQVEHPVTEMVRGVDLVEWQLRVAAGEALPGSPPASTGHAIEVRLYAEDPEQGFLPGSGTLRRLRLPGDSQGVRVDSGVEEGDTISIFYDPMIAKLIVHGEDRPAALARLREALAASDIAGPKSNIAFLERLIRHPAVVDARIDTGYLDRHLDEFLASAAPADPLVPVAAALAWLLQGEARAKSTALSSDPHSPWARADGWRIGAAAERSLVLAGGEARHAVSATGSRGSYRLQVGEQSIEVSGARLGNDWLQAVIHGVRRRWRVTVDGGRILVHDGTRREELHVLPVYDWKSGEDASGDQVRAPMPGRIVIVQAEAGDEVDAEQPLLVMEAMKMELTLRAPRAGRIRGLRAAAGDFVEADAVLVELEDAE